MALQGKPGKSFSRGRGFFHWRYHKKSRTLYELKRGSWVRIRNEKLKKRRR